MSRVPVLGLVAAGALLTAATVPVFAGEVYGKITIGSASVGDAATVAAKCGERSYPPQPTDKSGTYHLIVAEIGKCTLTIGYKGASASLDMVSNEDAVQYDIGLEMKDGKLTARRR